MDAVHFDALTRALTTVGSRRSAVVALLGGSLGLLGLVHPDHATAKSRKCKPACAECNQCKKGKCKRKNGRKRCKKGKCQPLPDGTACTVGTCQGGVCAAPIDPNACSVTVCTAATPCGTPGLCGCVAPLGAVAGRCVRLPIPMIVPCPIGNECDPGLQCIEACTIGPICTQPCF